MRGFSEEVHSFLRGNGAQKRLNEWGMNLRVVRSDDGTIPIF